MSIVNVSRRALLAVVAALGVAPVHAQAPAWPASGPIRLVVPFTPGSATDVIARALAEQLGPRLGQTIVVENRTGAGGTVGAAQVARAPADGYTLLVHSSGHVVNPALYPKLPYDTLADFVGITTLATLPNVLVTAPAHGHKDVADLVAKVRSAPDRFSYASAGNGSATHINAERFRLAAGLRATHVPYRGTPEAITDTMAARTDWFFAPLVSALPLIQSGRLQALAVGTAQRSPVLPDLPSIAEAGFPDAAYTFWVGLFAPAKTPPAVVARMHAETVQVLAQPALRERLAKLGAEPLPMPRAEFAALLRQETEAAARLVRDAGIRVE